MKTEKGLCCVILGAVIPDQLACVISACLRPSSKKENGENRLRTKFLAKKDWEIGTKVVAHIYYNAVYLGPNLSCKRYKDPF